MKYSFLALLAFVPAMAQSVDYARDVEPLLKARCYGCHGAAQQMKGLRLDNKDSALSVGNLLIARVTVARTICP